MGWSAKSIRFSTAAGLGALLLASLLLACKAQAEALERALRVTPGATCLDADRLAAQIARRLGSRELNGALSVEVRGSPSFARFVEFEVLQAGTTGTQRRFEPGPADCEDLHAALGLAIALTIKASLREVQGEHPSAAQRARAWRVGGAALVGLMLAPGAGYGADLHVQRAFARRFAGRLGALAIGNPRRTFAESPGRFDAWLVSGHADACAQPGVWARATLATCVGFAFGGLYAQGEGLAPSASAARRLLALTGALELAFALRRGWSLSLSLSALLPLESIQFVVRDEAGTVVDERELSVVGGFVSLGPAYNF